MTCPLFPLVILAGGLATRLYPVTTKLPKSLVLINGEPFIYHQLRWLQEQSISHVILCLGYLGEQVEALVGNGSQFNLHIQYVYDGPNLQGTGGAIKRALPHLADQFFVLYGDSYLNCDFYAVQQTFQWAEKRGLMTIFRNQSQWDTSNVEFSGEEILTYDKINRNERMNYIDYGLGILSKQIFQTDEFMAPFDLAAVYQSLLHKKELAVHEVKQRFYEVGSFAGIKELEYYLCGQNDPAASTG